jgi:hypothetical protein
MKSFFSLPERHQGLACQLSDEETELAPSHMAAATGDMPTYQIRAPTTALPQRVVMATSPGSLQSPATS